MKPILSYGQGFLRSIAKKEDAKNVISMILQWLPQSIKVEFHQSAVDPAVRMASTFLWKVVLFLSKLFTFSIIIRKKQKNQEFWYTFWRKSIFYNKNGFWIVF